MVYKCKEQYMYRSTLCEIKYMNSLCFFSKAGYMIGVCFKILTLTPVLKLPRVPPLHTHTHTHRHTHTHNYRGYERVCKFKERLHIH